MHTPAIDPYGKCGPDPSAAAEIRGHGVRAICNHMEKIHEFPGVEFEGERCCTYVKLEADTTLT